MQAVPRFFDFRDSRCRGARQHRQVLDNARALAAVVATAGRRRDTSTTAPAVWVRDCISGSVIPCAPMSSSQAQPRAAVPSRPRLDAGGIDFAPAFEKELDAQGVSAASRRVERPRSPAATKSGREAVRVEARDESKEQKQNTDAVSSSGSHQPLRPGEQRISRPGEDSTESGTPGAQATSGSLEAGAAGANDAGVTAAAAAAVFVGVAPAAQETPENAALTASTPEALLPAVAAEVAETGAPVPHEAFTIRMTEERDATPQPTRPVVPQTMSRPVAESPVTVEGADRSRSNTETQVPRGVAAKPRTTRPESEAYGQTQPPEETGTAAPARSVLPAASETAPPRAESRTTSSSAAGVPAPPQPVQETPRQVQDITLKLDGPNQEKIRLQVTRVGDAVRVAVHANTPETAQSLRGSLPQLLSRFEKSGFRPDAPLTAGGVAGPSKPDESFAGSRESLHDQARGDSQRQQSGAGGERRHRRSWMDEWGRLSYQDDL